MASSSWSLEIAGGASKPVCFGQDLPQRTRRRFSSLRLNPPLRRGQTAAAALEFHPTPSISPVRIDSLTTFAERARDGRHRITPQKLDDWMRESVGEIVRNIGKAPFLVRIFSDESESKQISSMIEKEDATAESWLGIKKRWEQESSVPDGVILVEELNAEEDEEGDVAASNEEGGDRSNVRWGVVIQGRGMDCSACYILDTSKVRSSMGFCTHFCLVRAKCFGDPVGVQLKNAWLQSER
ncbi:hypothetical protein KFK09_023528 [Dendrobium nobile]|uniref:DUF7804 domain-containing protein n=1 Tax=Dendrobium nobile TaxID=94219 RepID=A0A8T3AC93_DENNO|nr:hypothetical protein KFK09_023528 [Dendrobium nobile]